MRIYKCDRCKKEVNNIDRRIILIFTGERGSTALVKYDTCLACVDQVKGLMENKDDPKT